MLPRMFYSKNNTLTNVKGFTLIEILLVIVVIGFMVTAVQINFSANKPLAKLEQEAARFASVFNLAAEYGLLNNIELGLFIQNGQYQFVGFDGVRWSPLPDNQALANHQIPENMEIILSFDDLPIEEPTLINRELFEPDDDTLEEMREQQDNEEEKPLIIPQVYLLSGGDITPFSVEFSLTDPQESSYFQVVGLYTTPVTVKYFGDQR